MPTLPPPVAFGLPDKYTEWRENQDEACTLMAASSKRYLMAICPTGFGKSLTYMTAGKIIPGRTVILTSTKGLQEQLLKDFGNMDGFADIRGRGNYTCRMHTSRNCDEGLCLFGVKCDMMEGGGCPYYDALRRANSAKVVVTNYAYWMAQNEYSTGLGQFDLMVLDEAHAAPDHLIDHLAVQFSRKSRVEAKVLALQDLPNDPIGWRLWAEDRLEEAIMDRDAAKFARKEKLFVILKRLVEKLTRLATRLDSNWVWEDDGTNVTLTPIWGAPFSEDILFLGVPHVVLTSATCVPKTADLLGVDRALLEVVEFPHSFPLANRPLIHIPTVRMNYRMGPMEYRQWITKIDQIIRDREDTKGIIHTVSYERRDMVLEQSKYATHMVTHDSTNTVQVVGSFKRMDPPAILVSPSMATGWDFPYDECRWQIIGKLPYPDTRGGIIKARSKRDGDYTAYITMQQLIQATGRGVRAEDDWCETFIIDNNIVWFLDRNRHLMVDWFAGAFRVQRTVPKPFGKE